MPYACDVYKDKDSWGLDDLIPRGERRNKSVNYDWMEDEIKSLLMDGYEVDDIAEELGLKKCTISRFISQRNIGCGELAL